MKKMETLYRTSEIRLPDNVEESRTVQFVISDSTKDRYRTVLNPDGWDLDNFNRNGIVGYQHDVYGGGLCEGPNPDSVIGQGRAWLEGSALMGEVRFEPEDINPLAQKIFRKVVHGTLKATSVGFIANGGGRLVNDETGKEQRLSETPHGIPEGYTFYFDGQELLEFSIVNIPANPSALKKNLRGQTANALQFIKRQLGGDWKYGDIEKLRVMDVIELLENPKSRETFNINESGIVENNLDLIEQESQKIASGLRDLKMRKINNNKAINQIG